MRLQEMSDEAICRMVHESTVASARLEGRVVPDDHVRPIEVQRLLDTLLARDENTDRA